MSEVIRICWLNKYVSHETSGVAHKQGRSSYPACGSRGDLYALEYNDPGGPYCKRCFKGLLDASGFFLPGKRPNIRG